MTFKYESDDFPPRLRAILAYADGGWPGLCKASATSMAAYDLRWFMSWFRWNVTPRPPVGWLRGAV